MGAFETKMHAEKLKWHVSNTICGNMKMVGKVHLNWLSWDFSMPKGCKFNFFINQNWIYDGGSF